MSPKMLNVFIALLIINKPTVFNPTFNFINFVHKLILSEKDACFHIFTTTKPQRLIIYLNKSETSWLLKGYVFLEPNPNRDTLQGVSRHLG